MTIMTFLLLIILFFAFFIYFSGLNPQEITIFFFADQSFTFPASIVILGCVVVGLALGYGAHLWGATIHRFTHWRRDRVEKKNKEVATIYREGVERLLSGDPKKARALLQKTVDRDRSRIESYTALASALTLDGLPQEGLKLLLKAKAIAPKSLEVLFKLAVAYKSVGQNDDAAAVYQEILAMEEGNPKALRSLRDLHINNGRWQQAVDLQKQVLKSASTSRNPDDEKRKLLALRYEVARELLQEGQFDAAKSELKEIIRQAPDFVPARVSMGDFFQAQGDFDAAAKEWQEAYRQYGKSVFLDRLEDLYMEKGDPTALLTFYRNTLAQRSNDLIMRLFYGKLCLRLEMVDEAFEQLYAVENAGADTPQLHLLLAEAHRRRDRIDEAIDEYQKSLGLDSQLKFAYNCDQCGSSAAQWHSRCPNCGTWSSFSLTGRNSIVNLRPVETREIYHGERE